MTREEAIRRIKAWNLDPDDMEVLSAVIPELAESEDERIRIELKEAFEAYDIESKWNGIPIRSIFAWLENQKEQKPAECERQPEFKEVEYDFRGEKVKVMRPFFRDDKGREFSTTGQDTDLTWSVLREWCEIKGITPYDLYPRAEWSEEDEEMLDIVLTMVDCSTVVPHSGGQLHPSESYKKDISEWLKSLRPHWKPSEEQMEALHTAMYLEEMQFYGGLKDKLRDLYVQLKKL